jgi:hypothetical protein
MEESIAQRGIQNARYNNGVGYIIIAGDVDRELYIAKCMRSGTIGILTESNEVIFNAQISTALLNLIEFPQDKSQLGSCISYNNILIHNCPIVVAVLSKNDELLTQTHDQFVVDKNSSTRTVKVMGDRKSGVLQLSVDTSDDGDSVINLRSVNKLRTAKISTTVHGEQSHYCDDLMIRVEKSAKINIGTKKNNFIVAVDDNKFELYNENGDKVVMSRDSVQVLSKSVVLGNDSKAQKALLGQQLIKQLNLNKLRLTTLFKAIQSAPIAPQDGGASFKAALVAAISGLIEEDYSKCSSDNVKNS